MWRYKDSFVVNERGKVLDIHSGRDEENREIIAWNRHGKINQQWDIVYVDEWKEYKKGELNVEFGLYVERNFHIVSQLPAHRYLSIIDGRNMVIKTANSLNSQLWYFDQASLTIRTRENNRSWDITNSGRNQNMQVWNTNSGWY